MADSKHRAEVEKAFKKALSLDRSRIQLSRISKFGMLELSRQRSSPIQEISFSTCPFCKGRGVRPSLESTALAAYRRLQSQAVKGFSAVLNVSLPYEVADYLQNQKRSELLKLESQYDMDIHISGSPDMAWDLIRVDSVGRQAAPVAEHELESDRGGPDEPVGMEEEAKAPETAAPPKKQRRQPKKQSKGPAQEPRKIAGAAEGQARQETAPEPVPAAPLPETPSAADGTGTQPGQEPPKKKSRRRPRRRRRSGTKAENRGEGQGEVDLPQNGEVNMSGESNPPDGEAVFDLDDEDDSFGGFFSSRRH